MATATRTTGLTYTDLEQFPEEDGRKYELIDGELFVTPAPLLPHGRVALRVGRRLLEYVEAHGGDAYTDAGLYFDDRNYVIPDLTLVTADKLAGLGVRHLDVPPDLAVEVSSPSTRGRDRGRKRELYEQRGVPEYWFVDLDGRCVEVYRLEDGRYGEPLVAKPGDQVAPPHLPGLVCDVTDLLGLER